MIAVLLLFASALPAERVPGRYIVELTTEPVTDVVARTGKRGAMRSAEAEGHRTRVRSEQQQMRGRLQARKAKVLDTVSNVANAMFVEATDADAADLAKLPGVKRVVPVRMLYRNLNRAVLLHKVADAWNQVGHDNAGAGMKIGIIDSGIEVTHAGFQDSSLQVPDGFPKASSTANLAFTNSKVIVARSYANLLPVRDPDTSARDRVGHGTALAMIAAGVRNAGPLATIEGVAPKAYLGNYKVFGSPGVNDGTTDDAVMKAIDDAVADGMDVINLSLGTVFAPRPVDDPEVQAVERASRAGVIDVVAAGNDGPSMNTLSSPATAPSAIAAGATTNDRTFAASVEVSGVTPMLAIAGSGPTPSLAATGSIVDVAAVDSTGLACNALPQGSLSNSIALILRGTCTFEIKLTNAQRAGATAAIVYAAQDSPSPISMSVGSVSLPAEMISHSDGLAIKQLIASGATPVGTLRFTRSEVPIPAHRVADFSASGPNPDGMIKPDVMAAGGDLYVATQTFDPQGDMYSADGFAMMDGTSFSAPVIAGAAALLKSARPGLTVDQYRSLLINSGGDVQSRTGQVAPVQQSGAGLLDMVTALRSTSVAYPTSISFGAGGPNAQFTQTLRITNVGANEEDFQLSVNSRDGVAPMSIDRSTVSLGPGQSVSLPVSFSGTGLAPGSYEGFLTVTGASGAKMQVPYWYAVKAPASTISVLEQSTGGRRGNVQRQAVLFRVLDSSGVALTDVPIDVTVVSGDGSLAGTNLLDSEIPGLWSVDLRLGPAPGNNVFRIQVGDAVREITITGR